MAEIVDFMKRREEARRSRLRSFGGLSWRSCLGPIGENELLKMSKEDKRLVENAHWLLNERVKELKKSLGVLLRKQTGPKPYR